MRRGNKSCIHIPRQAEQEKRRLAKDSEFSVWLETTPTEHVGVLELQNTPIDDCQVV